MSRKVKPSWENPKDKGGIHSPIGVEKLRAEVRYGLQKKYKGLAQTMFRYDFDERFEDMCIMCENEQPERFLMKNGKGVWFEDPMTGQIHFLPLTASARGVNMYGKLVSWYPVPVGTTNGLTGTEPEAVQRIRNMELNYENSVIMKNDLFGGNDEGYIDAMIDELVDNTLTMNQLQLIAKCPFVFNVTEDNLVSAKQFFLSMSQDKPAIFVNSLGDKPVAVTESTQATIDPALFELFDRFECQILEYLGFPCVPITKRAQQTVSEVQSNDDKIRLRRMEKLRMREKACERMKELWGVNVTVHSVIDELIEEQAEKNEEQMESDNDAE